MRYHQRPASRHETSEQGDTLDIVAFPAACSTDVVATPMRHDDKHTHLSTPTKRLTAHGQQALTDLARRMRELSHG